MSSMSITTVVSLLTLTNAMSIPIGQNEGERCYLYKTNTTGICTVVPLCSHAKDIFQKDESPQYCGTSGDVPRVCCPLPPGRLSRIMCAHYYVSPFFYHEVISRHDPRLPRRYAIYPGVPAQYKEFPQMAAVGFEADNRNIIWLCGGTLISHFFVLSAAHCVKSPEYGEAKWVRLGDLDLKNTTDGANPKDYRIEKVYVHPQYKRSSVYHDIALFKLDKMVIFYDVLPACLQTTTKIPVSTLQAVGWGKRGWYGESSSHLMKVSIKAISHRKCVQRYAKDSTRRLEKGILENIQICAGDISGGDTCQGDSGGPLHFLDVFTPNTLQHFVVVGVTSFGKMCGLTNSAGVYTRVSAYIGWIEGIVWAEEDYDVRHFLTSFLLYN